MKTTTKTYETNTREPRSEVLRRQYRRLGAEDLGYIIRRREKSLEDTRDQRRLAQMVGAAELVAALDVSIRRKCRELEVAKAVRGEKLREQAAQAAEEQDNG